jgi:two-component system, NarL family, sensor kinase
MSLSNSRTQAARDLIPTDPNRAVQLLSELLDQTDSAVEDIRRVAHELRPPVLDALGLVAALRVHAGDQQLVRVEVDVRKTCRRYPPQSRRPRTT